MTECQTVWVWLYNFDGSPWHLDGNDEPTLSDVLGWLTALLNQVPEEHRGSVTVEIHSGGGYDYANIEFKIGYFRPETDAELAHRLAAKSAKQRAKREKRERREKLLEQARAQAPTYLSEDAERLEWMRLSSKWGK